jgi:hypothetical protein
VSVHTASEMTMHHTRFLLIGVRLSAEPAACLAPSLSEDENSNDNFSYSVVDTSLPSAPATSSHGSDNSSISEYLTKTLLGWHVKDFLVDEATAAAATNIGVSADASSYQVGVGVGHLVSWPLFVRYPDPHGPIAMVN